jgi:hypothetical protein
MMKSITFVVILFCLLFSNCANDETDTILLEKDRKELNENLYSDKVLMYKTLKICIRASANSKEIPAEFVPFISKMQSIQDQVIEPKNGLKKELSVLDYISLYKAYSEMKAFSEKTDEDIFPAIIETNLFGRQNKNNSNPIFLSGTEKTQVQNVEHAVLSALVILSQDLGTDISLYECTKTNPDLMEDNQIKGLLQFYRGFLFFTKKLHYLSENEITNNIKWLDKNPNVDLSYVKLLFKWQNLNQEQTHLAFNAINYLFRGFDRQMMDREIDEKRSLDDFQVFLDNTQKLGVNNELTNIVAAFLYIKTEDNQKAIDALTNLKQSEILTNDDRNSIVESIDFLKNRKKGEIKNTVCDKIFMTKIATKFMFSMLSKVDWKAVLKENNIENTDQVFESIENYKKLMNNISKYSSGEVIEKTGKELESKGKNFLEEAKKLLK